jgi:ribose 5-phosphate isomerase B
MAAILITEADVRRAAACGEEIRVEGGAVLTPGAQDAALKLGVRIIEGPAPAAAVEALRARRVVAIGADHAGFEAKEDLKAHLEAHGYLVLDLGTRSRDPVDYPDIAERVARAVAEGRAEAGILVDGAGIGSAIAANKIRGIRAAKCDSLFDARNAREHNHANVLALGTRIERETMRQIARVFLETPFGPGRHERRVRKIEALERKALVLWLAGILFVACDKPRLPIGTPPPDPHIEVDPEDLRSIFPPPGEPVLLDEETRRAQYGSACGIAAYVEYRPPDGELPLVARAAVYPFDRSADLAYRNRIRAARFRTSETVREEPPLGTDCVIGAMQDDSSWRALLLRGQFVVECVIPDEARVPKARELLRSMDEGILDLMKRKIRVGK